MRHTVAIALAGALGACGGGGGSRPDAADLDAGTVGPRTDAQGLRAAYHEGLGFETVRHVRVDETVDFEWQRLSPGPRVPVDAFSVRWTGWIRPRFSELYTLHALTDDGVRVFVDGEPIISDWVERTIMESTGTVALTADRWHLIRVEYFDKWDVAAARLFWSSPSQPREIIPAVQLSP